MFGQCISTQFWHQKFYRPFVPRIEMIVSGFIKGTKYYSARRTKLFNVIGYGTYNTHAMQNF
jgi:hypothetical protein